MNLTETERSHLHFLHLLDQEANDTERIFLVVFHHRNTTAPSDAIATALRRSGHGNACLIRAHGPAHAIVRAYDLLPRYRSAQLRPLALALSPALARTVPTTIIDAILDAPTRRVLLAHALDETSP